MKIYDHDTSHAGRKSNFRFWVQYQTISGLNDIFIDFADFAAYMVASGEFDGYDDSDDDGEMWRYTDRDNGACQSYDFNEVISDFLLCGDFDGILAEYITVKLSSVKEVEAAI